MSENNLMIITKLPDCKQRNEWCYCIHEKWLAAHIQCDEIIEWGECPLHKNYEKIDKRKEDEII